MAEHFLPKGDITRVEVNVGGYRHDKDGNPVPREPVVVTESGLETADPFVINALTEQPTVKKVTKAEFESSRKAVRKEKEKGD
jgi:hypothetical protein